MLEWFTHNGLSLNPTKTEVLNIGTRNGVGLMKDVPFVQVAGCQIKPADDIKSLGVTLDCHLSFDKHVDLVCKSTSYHIRALRHIRASITFDMAKTVAHAIVGSKLDYCNSLLAGMTSTNLNKLQRIQNSLARVVTGKRKFDNITPVLKELHWLPIARRIDYKLATIVYKTRATQEPQYLNSLLIDYVPGRNLRSMNQQRLTVPRYQTETASRRFSVCAPRVWNSLPLDVRNSVSIASFRKNLKTYYFGVAYKDK